jgi:hypothetical protein
MKCMGDFGSGYSVDAGDDSFENEMGFKLKWKKPKFKISPPKISIPKIISKPISAITKPVTSIASSIVKNPAGAIITGAGVALAPAAIAASVIPGVNKITAPVTDTIKAAASPVTSVVAPVILAPVSMVSPGIAQAAMIATQPTMPKMSAQQEVIMEDLAESLDTAPAAILTSPSAPAAIVGSASPTAILSNTSPAVTINSDAKPVLDTIPATIISSSPAQPEKKGNAGAVIGGLAVAGIAAYFFMKE